MPVKERTERCVDCHTDAGGAERRRHLLRELKRADRADTSWQEASGVRSAAVDSALSGK